MATTQLATRQLTAWCAANAFTVTAGTNCLEGGDIGSAGRALFAIENAGGSCLCARINNGRDRMEATQIKLTFCGDIERLLFIEALKAGISALRNGEYHFQQSLGQVGLMDVTVGTTCPGGGNYSHGGWTRFRLQCCGAHVRAEVDGRDYGRIGAIEIVVGGDTEYSTFIEALEFALVVLSSEEGPTVTVH